jgi:hypothetical protein
MLGSVKRFELRTRDWKEHRKLGFITPGNNCDDIFLQMAITMEDDRTVVLDCDT